MVLLRPLLASICGELCGMILISMIHIYINYIIGQISTFIKFPYETSMTAQSHNSVKFTLNYSKKYHFHFPRFHTINILITALFTFDIRTMPSFLHMQVSLSIKTVTTDYASRSSASASGCSASASRSSASPSGCSASSSVSDSSIIVRSDGSDPSSSAFSLSSN